MALKNTTKSVTYRRCVISPAPGRTLQQLLGAALVTRPKPADRYEPINAQSTELRFIGLQYVEKGCLCGYLTSFERGAAQPVVADDPAAASLRLSALAPPPAVNGAPQEQYIPGILYFVVYKDHVAVVQSPSMRSSALETHINWLLKSRTSELPATSTFALSNEAQKATKQKIQNSHVKAISLGQPLMAEVIIPPGERVHPDGSKSVRKKEEKRFKPEGALLDYIQTLFQDQSAFEKLGFSEIFDGNLEVWLQIRYPKRKRSKPEDTMKLMDTLGVALRDIEGDQVCLELANGHKVTGQELKISGTVDAAIQGHNLPDERQLLSEMIAWLTAQINNGVVDP